MMRLAVHLVPVTKVQFEGYLAQSATPGDEWYEEVLAIAPRASWRSFTTRERERIFMTGILPREAVGFARWLGPQFRLATTEEWRSIYGELSRSRASLNALDMRDWHPAARNVVATLSRQMSSTQLLDIGMMRRHRGLVEWTTQGRSWVGLGSPRMEFHPNWWDPLRDHSVTDSTTRYPFVGFRLIGPAL